jgi:Putative Flp pilus-assembly TadE/G-like
LSVFPCKSIENRLSESHAEACPAGAEGGRNITLRENRPTREHGQTLILVMVALPLFFALMALVVDGGNVLVHRRNIQVAADAAALAIAQSVDLSTNSCNSACSDQGRTFADKNGIHVGSLSPSWHKCNDSDPAHPSDTNCWAYPYVDTGGASHNDQVEVRLQAPVATFFVGVADALVHGGINTTFKVSARAVASTAPQVFITPGTVSTNTTPGTATTQTDPGTVVTNYTTSTSTTGGGAAVLFARCGLAAAGCTTKDACTGLHISGSNNRFDGAFWTNGGVQDSGQNFGDPAHGGNAILYYNPAIAGSVVGRGCLITAANWWSSLSPQAPIDWPVPLPVLTCSDSTTGTTCPSGTFVTKVNGVNCTHLPSAKYTVNSANDPSGRPWSGLYCADTSITVNQAGISLTNAGFIAPAIGWSSGTNSIKGYTGLYSSYGGLLFDAYSDTGGLNMSGSKNSWTGGIFVPNDNAQVSGGGAATPCAGTGDVVSGCGWIEARTIQLSGSDGSFRGLGPTVGGTTTTVTVPVSTTTTPGSTTVIISPGTTATVTTPAQTSTTGTTLALKQ